MKDELQQKLYDKYPKLFKQKDLPMSLTNMCYGLCVGDGWYPIMDVLCSRLQDYVDRKQKENPEFPQIEFSQIKEKFGGLRVYVDKGNDVVYSLISFAEGMAARTCEECGEPGRNRSYRSWYITLCESCGAEQEKRTGYPEDKEDEEEQEC